MPWLRKTLVEGPAELRVAIVDQEARRRGSVGERPGELARLLGDPCAARMAGAAHYVHPVAAELDEEEDVEPGGKDGVNGEEVAREHARRLAADELAPGDAGSPVRRSEPCLAKELANRRRRDAEPERGELARDPLIAPPGILAREAEDELTGLSADRRSPGLPCRIGPASRDKLAMPAQERVRRDEERAPALARNAPARRGEERPIGPPKYRPRDLTPKDRKFAAKHDDLELLELLGAARKRDKLKQSLQSDVEQ